MSNVVPGTHVRSPKTFRAGAAIVAHRAVKDGADSDSIVPATLASVNRGISIDAQDTIGGDIDVAIDPSDQPEWESGAAFGNRVRLTSDANGRAIEALSGNPVTAISLRAASAANQLIPVQLLAPGTGVAP